MSSSEPADDDAGEVASSAEPRSRSRKAPNAFRTISEVADDLHIPQHVLRFWETKFPQVKPLKRGGGRRYYRPDDIALLRRISGLLYIQGYTIKGVQRLLREGGGQLSDDIPPPAPEEKAGPETESDEHDEPQLPMPGLTPVIAPGATRARARGEAARNEVGQGDTVPVASEAGVAEAENRRLRQVLRETLRELEALRALLG